MMTAADIKPEAVDALFDKPVETDEDRSKDEFFIEVARVAEAMVARHGKDFAMGVLVLSARFIAEGKPLIKRNGEATTTLSSTN